MSLSQTMGEQAEAMGGRTVVPDSYYIASLTVSDFGTSEKEGTAFAQLAVTIAEGPFTGETVTENLYLTPGKIKQRDGEDKAGNFIKFLNHACRAVTGKTPDDVALVKAGFEAPEREATDDDAGYSANVRMAFQYWYRDQAPDVRLATMLLYLRVKEWDGKTVVVHLRQDSEDRQDRDGNKIVDPDTGKPEQRVRNSFGGFYPLSDTKKGAKFVRAVAHGMQERAKGATA